MNKFLVKYDCQTLIDEDNLDEITDGSDRVFYDALDAAVEKVAGYIRHRYDYNSVFAPVIPYADATEFEIGDRVYWSEVAFSATSTYTAEQRVSYNGNIYSAIESVDAGPFDTDDWNFLAENNTFYYCTAASTGNLPNDTDYFTEGDNRNPLIKEITIDIVLYNIHSKISPRNIPDVRRTRYDGFGNLTAGDSAIATLKQIQKGVITLDLPIITPDVQNSQRISWGISSNANYNY